MDSPAQTIQSDGRTLTETRQVEKMFPGADIKREGDLLLFCTADICIPFFESGKRRYEKRDGRFFISVDQLRAAMASPAVRADIPDIPFENVITGQTGRISDFRGKKTLAFCWASW